MSAMFQKLVPITTVFAAFCISANLLAQANGTKPENSNNEAQVETTQAEAKNTEQDQTTKTEKAFLGVQITAVPPAVAAHIPRNLSASNGVLVAAVTPDSPAEKAGLKKHDILTHINGKQVTSAEDVTSMVAGQKPKDTLTVTYLRGGEKVETSTELGTAPIAQTTVNQFPLTKPGTFWMSPFDEWLATPLGKKQFREFDRQERDRQNSPVTWSKFQSMSVTKAADGTYTAQVEYNDNNEKKINREFTGSRDEIRDEINSDKELPEATREHLLRSLDQQTPDMFRFSWPGSFQEMFDKDWNDFSKELDF